ncbi:glycosyltransferase family 2 protein [Verrucomicrobiota bacterium]
MLEPKVSVVIPTYNRAGLTAESIDSVLAQDFDGFEVIVVDDGSTDDTQKVLQRYKGRIVSEYQTNAGFSAARTRGMEIAQSDLIAFHDSDDIMLPGRLGAQTEFMKNHPEVAAVSGNMLIEGRESIDYFQERGIRFDEKDWVIFENAFEKLLNKNFMADPASMIRRKCFEEAGGYDVSLRSSADWDLWMKVSRKRPLACIKKTCTKLRLREDSLSISRIQSACAMIVIDRALGYDEKISPAILKNVRRKLYSFIGHYIVLNFDEEIESGWRIKTKHCAKHLPFAKRLFIAFAASLPHGLGALLTRRIIIPLLVAIYGDPPERYRPKHSYISGADRQGPGT